MAEVPQSVVQSMEEEAEQPNIPPSQVSVCPTYFLNTN
jgi:hypothetical protein